MQFVVLLFIAFLTSLGFVLVYYLAWAGIAIGVMKFLNYDKPNGLLYKVIDFPMALPGILFDAVVPSSIKRKYFAYKPGYLRKSIICFVLNVMIYFVPAYFLLSI